jgi:hypothetical protein
MEWQSKKMQRSFPEQCFPAEGLVTIRDSEAAELKKDNWEKILADLTVRAGLDVAREQGGAGIWQWITKIGRGAETVRLTPGADEGVPL